MSDARDFCCSQCSYQAALELLGSPCEVCGKTLTERLLWVQKPGVCNKCGATYKMPRPRMGEFGSVWDGTGAGR